MFIRAHFINLKVINEKKLSDEEGHLHLRQKHLTQIHDR